LWGKATANGDSGVGGGRHFYLSMFGDEWDIDRCTIVGLNSLEELKGKTVEGQIYLSMFGGGRDIDRCTIAETICAGGRYREGEISNERCALNFNTFPLDINDMSVSECSRCFGPLRAWIICGRLSSKHSQCPRKVECPKFCIKIHIN